MLLGALAVVRLKGALCHDEHLISPVERFLWDLGDLIALDRATAG